MEKNCWSAVFTQWAEKLTSDTTKFKGLSPAAVVLSRNGMKCFDLKFLANNGSTVGRLTNN